jgi:enoyl-CoA hydratase/carnithine racemase
VNASNADPPVTIVVADHVATVSLVSLANRNALSMSLIEGLHAALDDAEAAGARVVVIRHDGPAFCAGMDLRERTSGSPEAATITSAAFVRVLERLETMEAITIAAVEGAVRAGGVGLMAACDLIVVRPVRIGVAPAIISRPVLRRAPWSAVAAAFLTGEAFGAADARAMGLVTHISDDVPATVRTLTTGVLHGAPGAVAATKRLLRDPGRPDRYDELQALSDGLFAAPEGQEGMRSFLERRSPSWSA